MSSARTEAAPQLPAIPASAHAVAARRPNFLGESRHGEVLASNAFSWVGEATAERYGAAEDSVNLVGVQGDSLVAGADRKERKRTVTWIQRLLVIGVGLLAAALAVFWLASGPAFADEVERQLTRGSRVLVLGQLAVSGVDLQDSELLVQPPSQPLREALADVDGEVVALEMEKAGVTHLLVAQSRSPEARAAEKLRPDAEGRPTPSVAARLEWGQSVPGLQTAFLWPEASLVVPDGKGALPDALGQLMATVARRVLAGEPSPRREFFPEPLRRQRSSEVMVMLRDRGEARLWRSARGPSLASALTTAASVARNRWKEREVAMGGDISEKLRSLDVEVVLLRDEGTLGNRTLGFVEHAFGPEHGVAYEYRGAWKYKLAGDRPDSPARAYEELFKENGLSMDALSRSDLRLYRLLNERLGTSEGW